jgi:chitinase
VASIGGANDDVRIYWADKARFREELESTIDKYGFMGVDVDLEGASITAADNIAVIAEVLREMKTDRLSKGQPFVITLAPEFYALRTSEALYKPLIDGLEGYYDLIFPQFYNHGLDGVWSSELEMYLSSNNDEFKAEFLYLLAHSIATGTNGFVRIPADKLAIGLPASPTSALSGYVSDPLEVEWALDRLEDEGNQIRGLMTWSINQDAANGYEFMDWYAPYIYGRAARAEEAAELEREL